MISRLCWVSLAVAAALPAGVMRVHVTERSDVLGGAPMGSAGPYERIVAKVHFAVDPDLPANRIITDIGLAPRNAAGLVEFSSDLYVLKPRDPAKGNATVLYEVSNRGRKGMLGSFNLAPSSLDPRTPAHFGDRTLLQQGFTLVWLGWQADVPRTPGLLRLYAPVATDGGRSITGLLRAEFTPDKPATVMPLADRGHLAYPVLDLNDPSATLTVRDRAAAPRRTVPRNLWRFRDAEHAEMPSGFEPGRIYEIVYRSKDPLLVGLGPAAIRDFISFLKYGGPETTLADQRRYLKHAIGWGVSQSGRFLRTFLYYGFNADEKGRRVFDGVWAHVAGAGRGSFNHRFAQPSRDGHPHLNTFYPTDIFPFSGAAQTDPETGLTDGILLRAAERKAVPKMFETNGSYEYWGRSAALIHTTIDGRSDLAPGEHARIYLLAGTQHGAGSFPPRKSGTQQLSNPNDYRWILRALLPALLAWVKEGKQPPPSRIPLISRGELVPLDKLRFPRIPGVAVPARPQRAWRVDYGPRFRTEGIVTKEPPEVGSPFPVLVPQVDADGNEIAGIRLPCLQAPLGTYTGWNLRDPSIGAPEELFSMVGSFLPFGRTKGDRLQGDPRASIAERYAGVQDYLARVTAAAKELARGGYLLEGDIPAIVEASRKEWEYWTAR